MRLRLVSAAFAICLLPAVVAQARGVVHDGLEYGVKLASKTLQGWASHLSQLIFDGLLVGRYADVNRGAFDHGPALRERGE